MSLQLWSMRKTVALLSNNGIKALNLRKGMLYGLPRVMILVMKSYWSPWFKAIWTAMPYWHSVSLASMMLMEIDAATHLRTYCSGASQ